MNSEIMEDSWRFSIGRLVAAPSSPCSSAAREARRRGAGKRGIALPCKWGAIGNTDERGRNCAETSFSAPSSGLSQKIYETEAWPTIRCITMGCSDSRTPVRPDSWLTALSKSPFAPPLPTRTALSFSNPPCSSLRQQTPGAIQIAPTRVAYRGSCACSTIARSASPTATAMACTAPGATSSSMPTSACCSWTSGSRNGCA